MPGRHTHLEPAAQCPRPWRNYAKQVLCGGSGRSGADGPRGTRRRPPGPAQSPGDPETRKWRRSANPRSPGPRSPAKIRPSPSRNRSPPRSPPWASFLQPRPGGPSPSLVTNGEAASFNPASFLSYNSVSIKWHAGHKRPVPDAKNSPVAFASQTVYADEMSYNGVFCAPPCATSSNIMMYSNRITSSGFLNNFCRTLRSRQGVPPGWPTG
jgi:hypothetical protein